MGPSMLLRATCAPLDQYVFKKIKYFKSVFQKTIKNTIMLRCIFFKIQKYLIKKYFQIVFLVSKLFLNSDYKALKIFIRVFHSLD
jgi:hypothetical protein